MKENLQKALYQSGRKLKHQAPSIMTGLGVTGVVVTTISAIKTTPKACILLKQAEEDKDEELNVFETLRIATPIYIPTILLGLTTISLIIGADVLNKRNQASISSAYMLLNESYQKYKSAAKRVYGDDADSRIKAEMASDMYIHSDGCYLYRPDLDDSDKVLFYESHSEQYFTSTMAAVINAQYHFNRNLTLRGWVSLNEYRNFLGLDDKAGYDDIGWLLDRFYEDNIMWFDFANRFTELEDGLECYIISAMYDPMLELDQDIF